MKVKIEGKVYVAKEDDINTDLIIPARYLNTSDPRELAKHAMEDLDPARHPIPFLNPDGSCDYKILITGKNFGCGSSREHAVWALAAAGIEAVIAPAPVPFARIFYRNCVNEGGVIPLEYDQKDGRLTELLTTGENVTLDMSEEPPFVIRTDGIGFPLKPFTGIAREIIDAGGLTAYNKKRLASTPGNSL
jgi:3-isopropylmalate/(R)-2-methylmalate dehydratase small subunit